MLKTTARNVAELDPDDDSLVGSLYDRPDYRDQFAITVPTGTYASVDEVATDWFMKQPAWIRLLSTNTMSRKAVETAASAGRYEIGAAVGSWVVIERNEQEIVFGDNMGFMEYRFSIRLLTGDTETVEGSTAVRFLWRRTGRFYFALVRPLHRRFVKYLLVRTVA